MQNIYGYLSDPNKDGIQTAHIVQWQCLGAYYYPSKTVSRTGWSVEVPRNTCINFIRLNPDIIKTGIAYWFLDEIFFPNIPKHIKERFQIIWNYQRDKDWAEYGDNPLRLYLSKRYIVIDEGGNFNQKSLLSLTEEQVGQPWLVATLDVKELCTEEMFATFTFLRTPMETPHIVNTAWNLHIEKPDWTPFKCYLVACALCTDREVPTLFYASMFKGPKEGLDSYSLIDRWTELHETLWNLTLPHALKYNKDFIENYFGLLSYKDDDEKWWLVKHYYKDSGNQQHGYYVSPLVQKDGFLLHGQKVIADMFEVQTREARKEELLT